MDLHEYFKELAKRHDLDKDDVVRRATRVGAVAGAGILCIEFSSQLFELASGNDVYFIPPAIGGDSLSASISLSTSTSTATGV